MNIQSLVFGVVFFMYCIVSPVTHAHFIATDVVSNGANYIFQMTISKSYTYRRVYIDKDNNSSTGFRQTGNGSEYLIESGLLYKYTGNGNNWSWSFLKPVSGNSNNLIVTWTVNRSDLGLGLTARTIGALFQLQNAGASVENALPSSFTIHTVDSQSVFPNPERGFYKHDGYDCGRDLFSISVLRSYRSQNVSLLYCQINLKDFLYIPINTATLQRLTANLALVRAAGLKVIVRAHYGNDATVTKARRNASRALIVAHIGQLRPLFFSNSDVIATVQAGFIGVWGEWWLTTDEFGDLGTVSASQATNRKVVMDALLAAVPLTRQVALRTPGYKKRLFGPLPITPADAFNNSSQSRTGFHNDCFLADATDMGTFVQPTDRSYTANDARYVPMGGETCQVSSFSVWANAKISLQQLRFSYLNDGYNAQVLSSWGKNIIEVRRNLGYRISASHSFIPTHAPVGGIITARWGFLNTGYAAPFNARPMEIVFRNQKTRAITRKTLRADVRRWLPGVPTRADQNISLAGLVAGDYDVGVAFPDPATSIRSRSDYAIRLANSAMWDSGSGVNFLGHVIRIR